MNEQQRRAALQLLASLFGDEEATQSAAHYGNWIDNLTRQLDDELEAD